MGAWQESAACADHDEPDLFHPEGRKNTNDRIAAIADAKAVCAGCPVRTACLQHALDNGFEGIWGGLTDDERAQLRPKPEPSKHKAADDVAFVLRYRPHATYREVGERLSREPEAIKRAVARSGRTDLRDQLIRNAALAGFPVTVKEPA